MVGHDPDQGMIAGEELSMMDRDGCRPACQRSARQDQFGASRWSGLEPDGMREAEDHDAVGDGFGRAIRGSTPERRQWRRSLARLDRSIQTGHIEFELAASSRGAGLGSKPNQLERAKGY